MARFRYSMQNILDIKLKMETQAKQEFSAMKNALDDEEEKLEALRTRKRQYEEEAERLRMGTLRILELEANQNALLVMDEYIAAQREQVRKAEKRLEEAREKLAEVMKERKTQETLKDKAFEEFLLEENRAESKVVDELTSYTYGQKRQVNG
ncbi:MAG: flagellar export protein FliJ [Lachnospiraceae bacterium]|nr:flagellar export protein FliJ [Lachnospiraceae bacterium]